MNMAEIIRCSTCSEEFLYSPVMDAIQALERLMARLKALAGSDSPHAINAIIAIVAMTQFAEALKPLGVGLDAEGGFGAGKVQDV